ncbi:hypothetical protein POM88_042011 [Heracleum sosnowskyi]|uniref:F-box associated beta-propeller type 1 domain-containing protein n=1 Tax=Heracleum sosnowskyi TaxID=360622 RepID=A0AAD8M8V0_9APIA|nr:hypothetical protein POM88_042011 [Heracleum sosnowskyi]
MVMYFGIPPVYPVADVYSLSTDSWKTTNNNLILVDWLFPTAGLFLNGTAFFSGISADREDIILSYDTDKDAMKMISFPDNGCATDGFELKVFRKSVALFMRNFGGCSSNVRILKEGGTNEVCWETI